MMSGTRTSKFNFTGSGIYQILNQVTCHFYIGSTKCFKNRWQTHLRELRSGNHGNPYLQAAFVKYGEQAFKFIILEEIEPDDKALKSAEQRYFDQLAPQYNINPLADRPQPITDWWVLFSPTDEDFLIDNLEAFCRQNQLDSKQLSSMNALNIRHSNGWYCRKATEEEVSNEIVLNYWRPKLDGGEEGLWWNPLNNRWLAIAIPQGERFPYRIGWFDSQSEALHQIQVLHSFSPPEFQQWKEFYRKPHKQRRLAGYKGVYPTGRRWKAAIYPKPENLKKIQSDPILGELPLKKVEDDFFDRSRIVVEIGIFDNPEAAAMAYNDVLIRLFGNQAILNTITLPKEQKTTWLETMKSFFQWGISDKKFITYLAYRHRIQWPYHYVSLEEAVRFLQAYEEKC
jgi:GIY-YIG catalytic domain